MAAEKWVVTETKYCEQIGLEVALEERRAFPGERIPDMECYRVLGHRCTADIACNLAGIRCRWAYTDPTTDRFRLRA